jgi:hypothetical protein
MTEKTMLNFGGWGDHVAFIGGLAKQIERTGCRGAIASNKQGLGEKILHRKP